MRDVFGGEGHVEEVVFVWVGGGHIVDFLLWYILEIKDMYLLRIRLVWKVESSKEERLFGCHDMCARVVRRWWWCWGFGPRYVVWGLVGCWIGDGVGWGDGWHLGV
jgi:hypothetical protein